MIGVSIILEDLKVVRKRLSQYFNEESMISDIYTSEVHKLLGENLEKLVDGNLNVGEIIALIRWCNIDYPTKLIDLEIDPLKFPILDSVNLLIPKYIQLMRNLIDVWAKRALDGDVDGEEIKFIEIDKCLMTYSITLLFHIINEQIELVAATKHSYVKTKNLIF